MQRNVKNLLGYDIQATDGELGKVDEFYFDDAAWTVRYLVAATGDWFSNRKVLLSPAFLGSYAWPTYWGSGIHSDAASGMAQTVPVVNAEESGYKAPAPEWPRDLHLRSTRHLTGYHIQAADGNIGHVDDFIVDDKSWEIRYLVVDTRHWLPGPKVLLAPGWLKKIDWATSKVLVESKRESIKNSPPYDPSKGINTDYEGKLYDYYGRLRVQR